MHTRDKNLAFIDGQNLYSGTRASDWKIDFRKFRTYLKEKYHVTEAYYFLGHVIEKERSLYDNLQKAGFIVIFKEQYQELATSKKGNVDTDIVFEIMKNVIDNNDFSKVIIVSGDGDYKKVVDYLIVKNRFKKILFPNATSTSSLYKSLGWEYFDSLEREDIKKKILLSQGKKKRTP